MSGNVKVTFAELDAARQQLWGSWQAIQTKLDDLQRYLAPLVSTWEGEAALSYQEKQRRWNQAADDLNQILHGISHTLGNMVDEYQNTEAHNRQRWQA